MIIEVPEAVTMEWINDQLDKFDKEIGKICLGWGAYAKVSSLLNCHCAEGHFFINGIYTERARELTKNEMKISKWF